jgi:DNA topoisomerase-1
MKKGDKVARLRRSDCSAPGITRRRRGRGFSYAYPDGGRVTDPEVLDRIRALAIPPAWKDVWICPWPNGHLQAVGTDADGRRQYRYHDDWRVQRDREKFTRVVDFARALPALRAAVEKDLACDGLTRRRVLAAAVRLLDIGLFRVGGEAYAEDHETFGVATLRKEHVRVRGDVMRFHFPAKGSIEQTMQLTDGAAAAVVAALRRRRAGGDNLFAYKVGRTWVAVHSDDVNGYIKETAGESYSAKDFRTWAATVLAAEKLAESDVDADGRGGRHQAVVKAVAGVAERLGNTPAVSRSAYIDPRVIDRFESGQTIAKEGKRASRRSREAVETAVIDLLDDPAP